MPDAIAGGPAQTSRWRRWLWVLATTNPPEGEMEREFAEAFLRARGTWDQVVEAYITDRSLDVEGDLVQGATQ